jgi:cysteine desulfurase
MTKRVYLDWNATAPPLPEVIEAMAEAARSSWGNPASIHAEGRAARRHVEDARAAVAALAGADPRDVVLTSGGTEANNLALRSAFASASAAAADIEAPHDVPRVIVTSAIEHPSVSKVVDALAEETGATLRLVHVLPDGSLDPDDLSRALAEPNVRLVALQVVNHETGAHHAIQAALSAKPADVPMHLDAVQAWGKVQMSDASLATTTRSLAAHKIRGPKGIGALIHPQGFRVLPLLRGGAQERGIRPGTVDPVAAAGLTIAAKHALNAHVAHAKVAELRDALVERLRALASTLGIAFDVITPAVSAGHVANVAFAGIDGPELVAALDLEGVAIASGSACSAGTNEPSPGITAFAGSDRAKRSLRISLGELTTYGDLAVAGEAFARVLGRTKS